MPLCHPDRTVVAFFPRQACSNRLNQFKFELNCLLLPGSCSTLRDAGDYGYGLGFKAGAYMLEPHDSP